MAGRSVAISLVLAVVTLFFVCGDRLEAQDDMMVLEHKDVFRNLERPPVRFSHLKHSDKYPDCIACHHEYEYKNNVKENVWAGEGKLCSECHKMQRDDRKLPLRRAFHQNCTGCHRTLKKQGVMSGPVTCGGCHVRAAAKPAP